MPMYGIWKRMVPGSTPLVNFRLLVVKTHLVYYTCKILKEAQNREDIKPDKNRILNKRKDKDPLEIKAQMIIEHTTQLQWFLSQNRGKFFI